MECEFRLSEQDAHAVSIHMYVFVLTCFYNFVVVFFPGFTSVYFTYHHKLELQNGQITLKTFFMSQNLNSSF